MWIKCIIGILAIYIVKYHAIDAASPDMLGPAEYTVSKFQLCNDPEKYPSFILVERKKINRTHDSFTFDMNFTFDFDNTTELYFNVARWGDGGYKPNAFILEKKTGCQFISEMYPDGLKDFFRGLNQPEDCPLKKGRYLLENYIINYDNLPNQMLYGDFRMDCILRKEGKDMLCLQIFAVTKPKNFMG